MMRSTLAWAACLCLLGSCGGGARGEGAFRLISFLESGRDAIPRNRTLAFDFSKDVAPGQDLFARLRIATGSVSAVGTYTVAGSRVCFEPRLPRRPDRADAGLRPDADYVAFVAAGLAARDGDVLGAAREIAFATSSFFEDPEPHASPRVLSLTADGTDLAGATLEPRASFRFELETSEPLDPATVTEKHVELVEIVADADGTATPVHYPVPVEVGVASRGVLRVVPRIALTDDTRYRLAFSGSILGIDFRKTFVGENGLQGGLGFAAEFTVRDGPTVHAVRTLTYDPLEDGVHPDAERTSALWDPAGKAVGALDAFGDGRDGDLSVAGGDVLVIDTGDAADAGSPFAPDGPDLDPDDLYNADTRPGRVVAWDAPAPFELRLRALAVAGTLRVAGARPLLLRVRGAAEVRGVIDASGGDGAAGGGAVAPGGAAGAGGHRGGDSRQGVGAANECRYRSTTCTGFQSVLDACAIVRDGFPYSRHGSGPGRGLAGGEAYVDYQNDDRNVISGTGGGGGSHAARGAPGEDRKNAGGAPGTDGPACSTFANVKSSGVIGVRGQPGPTYGDPEVLLAVGGSGGGAGGCVHGFGFGSKQQSGAGGGGGGGSFAILSAGSIRATGATLTARGGDGGRGFVNVDAGATGWTSVSGSGGGGAGGSIVLVSGTRIDLAGAALDAGGGRGGARPAGSNCNACNAGGDGGDGFVFLMDADGRIDGLDDLRGVLTVRAFDPARFGPLQAVTELFHVLAADPDYGALAPEHVRADVARGQRIRIFLSSAQADPDEPFRPDPATETAPVEVALVSREGAATHVEITGSLDALDTEARDAFVRVIALFEYDAGAQAAAGPFASVDRVDVPYRFN